MLPLPLRLTVLLLSLSSTAVKMTLAVDQTLEAKTKGEDVVNAVLDKIHESKIFDDDYDFLRRIAYVESKFGDDPNTYRDHYFGGIWQLDELPYVLTKQVDFDLLYRPRIMREVASYFKINWANETQWNELHKPLYSGLAARLHLLLSVELTYFKPIPQTIEEQARYWVTYYKNITNLTTTATEQDFLSAVSELEKNSKCAGKMDLIVLLDGSDNAGRHEFGMSLPSIADFFNLYSAPNVNKGFIVFGDVAEVIFNLNNTLNPIDMKTKVANARYQGKMSDTNEGILESVEVFEESKKPKDKEVPRILMVFTWGKSNKGGEDGKGGIPDIVKAKEAQIVTYSVGVGPKLMQETELVDIAYGDLSHVFRLNDSLALQDVIHRLNRETCRVPQVSDIREWTWDIVGPNEYRIYMTRIPREGITIYLNVTSGRVDAFFSYSVKSPSSAIYDGCLDNGMNSVSNNGNASYIYISVKGAAPRSDYGIQVVNGDFSSQSTSESTESTISSEDSTDSPNNSTESTTDAAGYLVYNIFLITGALVGITIVAK